MLETGNLLPGLRAYLETIWQSSSNVRVLEVGAGGGSLKNAVFSSLESATSSADLRGGVHHCCMSHYTHTDLSTGLFDKARKRFPKYAAVMEDKKLDLENDCLSQGIEPNSYDTVLAGNVIHATENLRSALTNVHQVLKPGGKLILQELTSQ